MTAERPRRAITAITASQFAAMMAGAYARRRNDMLLAAVADLMHDLDCFWGTARWLAACRIDRLFGFPILPGGNWSARPDEQARQAAMRAEKEAYVNYLSAMPESSREIRRRAHERINCKYRPRSAECARVWVAVYEYLISSNLSHIRIRPSDPDALYLPPAWPESGDC